MDKQTFESSFFSGNRARLRQLFTGTAPIVLTGAALSARAPDEAFPLYQDRNFWYLTGIDLPEIIMVIDKGKEYLIVPDREVVREAFDGAVDKDALRCISGMQDVYGEKEGWKLLSARLGKVQHVATLAAAASYDEFWGIYSNPARAALIRRLKEHNGAIELLDLRQHLARMRMVKQPEEIMAIRQAVDITIDTLKDVTKAKQLAKYSHEYQVEADLGRGYRYRGGEGHSFAPIVAGGGRACTMHNTDNSAALASGDLMLVDTGATWSHYCADITRTVALGGKPSRRQEQVHKAVLEAQQHAFSLIKPGVLPRDYENQVQTFIGEKLRELGVIKGLIEPKAVNKYFPHATSHYLGLDTHDVGDYQMPFEPGVVLAVEPGIYIPEEGIGVRIEDNVLVTADGCEVLSARLPRGLV